MKRLIRMPKNNEANKKCQLIHLCIKTFPVFKNIIQKKNCVII